MKTLLMLVFLLCAGVAYAMFNGNPAPANKPAPVATAESYTACGCGCCGGTEPAKADACVSAEELLRVKEEDAKAKASPSCAVMGCSLGKHYQTCE